MVNVGSVGQPRDGDNRACYVILEDGLAGGSPTEIGSLVAGSLAEDCLPAAELRF